MTTALEIGGVLLLAAILLAVAMFLVAFQLGCLITRDDEQREVEAAGVPKVGVSASRPKHGEVVAAVGFDRPLYVLPFDHRGSGQSGLFGWKGTLTAE